MSRTQLAFAAIAALLATPANAQVTTLGGGMAEGCYLQALAGHADRNAFWVCNTALEQGGLTRRDRAATYINRGIVRLNGGNATSALADFDTAIELRPDIAEGHINRGNALIEQGDFLGAIDAITRGIALNPEEPARAYYSRGLAHEERGDLRAAYDDYRRATELAPRWDMPRVQLARFRVSS